MYAIAFAKCGPFLLRPEPAVLRSHRFLNYPESQANMRTHQNERTIGGFLNDGEAGLLLLDF